MKTSNTTILKFTIVLLMVWGFTGIKAQTQFSAKDIDGTWTREDGMKISILGTNTFAEGSQALIRAVGKSGWPQNVVDYKYKYQKIKYVGGNTWKGINYRHRVETGASIEDGEAVFTMSDDKKSFKATGGYTYRKDQL